MSKQVLIPQAPTQTVATGQKQLVKIVKGQHVRLQELVGPDAKDASNAVASKKGQNLRVKFADGTEVEFENFYQECAGNACSVSLGGKDAGGFTIGADTPVGAALQDGGQLVYAHGDANSLMAMATGDSALGTVVSGLGAGVVSYAAPAASAGFGSTLGLIAGGIGLAAAAGGSGGSSAPAPASIPTFLVTGTGDAVSFGGTATGPITVTLSGTDASFTRDGITQSIPLSLGEYVSASEATLQSLKLVAQSGTVITLKGSLDNLQAIVFSIDDGVLGQSESTGMTINTSALEGVSQIVFDFEDRSDLVVLGQGTDLSNFQTIEIRRGTVDLSTSMIADGTEFLINSEVILTLAQFREIPSLVSASGLGRLTILVASSDEVAELSQLLADKILIGFGSGEASSESSEPNIKIEAINGDPLNVDVTTAVQAIQDASLPSIPLLFAAISALEQKIQGDGVLEEDFTTLAALKALIGAPANPKAVEGDADFEATGLYAVIGSSAGDLANQIGLTAEENNGTATGLYLLIQTSIAEAISDLEQKIQGDGVLEEDFTTLAALKALIGAPANPKAVEGDADFEATGLYAVIGSSAGDLANQIGLTAEENNGTATGLYSLIADLQSQIDDIVKPDLIQGNELENFIQMYPYAGQTQIIRVEAGEGDDRIDSADVATQIVGGTGADVINLTWKDTSGDKLVYQSVSDGQARAVTAVTFSNDFNDYREGSVLTLVVNDSEYSYTVTADDGETPQVALEGLAAVLRSKLMAADIGAAFVGYLYNPLNTEEAPEYVTYSELSDSLAYQVPYGKVFVPASAIVNNENASSVEFIAFFGINGGQSFTLTTEKVYDFTFNSGGLVVMTPEAMTTWLAANPQDPVLTLSDVLVPTEDVLSAVAVSGTTLTLYGADGVALDVQAGGDIEAAIENPGMVTSYDVTFSSLAADWPTLTNGDNTTVFDRELRVTINNGTKEVTVSVDVVYDSGVADQAASVTALTAAINAHDDLGGLTASSNGNTLTIVADALPQEDLDAPTFEVVSASVDKNGVQQETLVSFSADKADYYAGGTLSVTIAGKEISAAMVDGDANASVSNLITAVQQAKDVGETSVVFQFSTDIDASTVLNNLPGASRYAIDIVIGDVSVSENTSFDAAGKPETVGELVSYLNVLFDDVAVFSLNEVTNQITASTPATNAVTAPEGVAYPSLFLAFLDEDTVENAEGTVSVSKLDAIESVEQGAAVLPGTEVAAYLIDNVQSYTLGTEPFYVLVKAENDSAEKTVIWVTVTNALWGTLGTKGQTGLYKVDASLTRITGADGGLYVKFDSVASFAEALKLDGTGAVLSTVANITFPSEGVISIDGGLGAQPIGIGQENFLPNLTLTAATEALDPLQVTATLDYEGEYQQATISLEDAATYTAYDDGTATTRGSDVYYEGGKAYVTITGAGVDGVLGTGDDTSSTVSADMALVSSSSTITILNDPSPTIATNIAKQFTMIAPELIVISIDGTRYDTADFETYLSGLSPAKVLDESGTVSTATFVDLMNWINTLPGVDSAVMTGNVIDIRYESGVEGAITDLFINRFSPEDPNTLYGSLLVSAVENVLVEDGEAVTSQALVDAINEKINGSTSTTETAAVIRIAGNFNLNTKIADSADNWEASFSYIGTSDGSFVSGGAVWNGSVANSFSDYFLDGLVDLGGPNDQAVLSDLLAYIESLPVFESAVIDVASGDIVITTVGKGSDTNVSVSLLVNTNEFNAATTQVPVNAYLQSSDTGEDATTVVPDPVLSNLLANAAYDQETGEITLTANEAGAGKFAVSEVTLDYQGVKQVATISLESATDYTRFTHDEVALDTLSTDRGADVYFDDGKVYATIKPLRADDLTTTDIDESAAVTVSALMGADAVATAQELVTAINTAATSGALVGVIESASVDENGLITLTAANVGDKTFEVTDVRLDYQGVQQLASFELDEAVTYTVSSEGNTFVDTSAVTQTLDVFEIRVDDTIVNYFDALVDRGTSHYAGMALKLTFRDAVGDTVSEFFSFTAGTNTALDFASQVSLINDKLTALEADPTVGRELGSVIYEDGVIRVVAAAGLDVIGGNLDTDTEPTSFAYDVYVRDNAPDPDLDFVYFAIDGNGAIVAGNHGVAVKGPLYPELTTEEVIALAPVSGTNTVEVVTGGRGLADVYYDGGKAYVTIAPIDDLLTTDVDESIANAVTVSADMAPATAPTVTLTGYGMNPPADSQIIYVTIDGVLYSFGDGFYDSNRLTPQQMADGLSEVLLGKATVVLTQAGDLVITSVSVGDFATLSVEAAGRDSTAGAPNETFAYQFARVSDTGSSAAQPTSQALVDAINDQINGYETAAVAKVLPAGSNTKVLTGNEIITDAVDDLTKFTVTLWSPDVTTPKYFSFIVRTESNLTGAAFVVRGTVSDTLGGDAIETHEFYISDAEFEAGIRFTLNDFLDYINNSTFEGQPLPYTGEIVNGVLQFSSADASSGSLKVGVTGWEADVIFGTTGLFNDGSNLLTETYDGDPTPVPADPTLSALLESATLAADGTITLTGNDLAKESFSISDVTLDYAGVQQMAQASFSTFDADYYAGGKLRIVVDTTPGIADGAENDVVVEADMVAGDAAQSVQNLVDAINDKIVTTVPSNDASVAVGSEFTEATVVHDGTSASGYFRLEFFVEKDGVRQSYGADVYLSETGGPVAFDVYDGSGAFFEQVQASGPKTLGEFVTWLNAQTTISLPVTFSIDGDTASIVATADDPSLGVTVGLQVPDAFMLSFLPVVNADSADGFFTETATPEQQVPGVLGGVLSSVTYENGVITLTAKDAVKEQFTISDAEITYPGVKQQATADFSTDNADYFAGGEVSLTVNGQTFTQAMLDNDPDATLTALNDQIDAAITAKTLLGVESVSYSGGTITFTAASPENGTDEINITAVTINIPAITQVTEVDMRSVTFETREGSEGAPAINLTVGGVALTTASGVDDADSVRNMAQAVIEARDGIYKTAAVTTTTGVDGNGNPVAIIGGAGDLQLTDTLAYDVIRFSLSVDGSPYDLVFTPELKTTASATGSTVEDFITYVNDFFDLGVINASAQLVNGDIVISNVDTGNGVTGDVSFETLVGDKTITSLATGESDSGVDAVTPTEAVETPATLAIKLLSDPNANITSYNLTFVLTVDGTRSTLSLADPSVSPSNTKIEGLLVTLNAAPELNGLSFSYDAANAEILVTSDATGSGVSISVDDSLLISTNNFPQAIDYTVGTVSGGSVTELPAEPAVVVLQEFAALHLSSAVLDGAYDFTFTIAEGNPSFFAAVPGLFNAQNNTVADLIDYLNGFSPEFGATLTDAGIEIFSTRTGADVTLTVNRFELTTVNAGAGATLSDVVGAVNYVTGSETFSIEAAVPGADPLLVSGISYATEDTERTSVAQQVELLFFGDGTVDTLAVGSTVTLNLGEVSVSYTVTGEEIGDLSTAIAAALVSQLNDNHADLVSASASTLTGSVDTSLITLTAAVTGPNILGSVDDSTLSVSITGPRGASITAAAVNETVAGEVYFKTSYDSVFIYDETTGESEVARTGADRGTLAYDDSSYTLNGATLEQGSLFEKLLDIDDAAVTGEADDPIGQTITNPIDDALFYGDAPQLGADDKGVLTGGGVSQSFTNPGDAYVANSGSAATGTSGSGNATYYGDAALLGEDEEGTLTGDGVLQSFTNPDSEYAATSGSPVSGTVDTSEGAGDATFFGDDAVEGSIDLETGVFDGLGVDQTYTNPSSGYDALAGSPEFNDADANVGDPTLEGVSPGTYDETDTLTYDDGSASTTVDKIDVGDGSVTGDGGFTGESETTITDATADDDVFKVVQTEKGFAAFDWDKATVTIQSTASTGPDVVNDFQVGHDVITLEGKLAASTFYDGTVDEIVDIEVIEAISGFLKLPDPQVAFDLSANEFGLVSSSANRVLDASSIGIAEDVADLLNSVFDFADQSGGTSDNGLINTTIFAVTASDDASVTAIWAHTQSSSGDNTVEDYELNLLATVNTIDGEFGVINFDILQSQPVV